MQPILLLSISFKWHYYFCCIAYLALQKALNDASDLVRHQAALAFQTMMKSIGPRAINDVVPGLLRSILHSSVVDVNPSLVLAGLQEIVQIRPRELLDYLLPRLLSSPVSAVAANTLAAVAQVRRQAAGGSARREPIPMLLAAHFHESIYYYLILIRLTKNDLLNR